MSRSVAIIQSHYVPWAGFFDLIGGCTDVVILDSVAFSKNSFFNRNRLAGPNGDFWITIPVVTHGREGQSISEVKVQDAKWASKHAKSVEQSLCRSPFYAEYSASWLSVYQECFSSNSLSEINRLWLDCVVNQLNLKVKIHNDTDLVISETEKTERLIQLCQQLNADVYRTGPRGLAYLDISRFNSTGTSVEVIEYSDYYPYRKARDSQVEPVSILDNLANLGPATPELFQHSFREART